MSVTKELKKEIISKFSSCANDTGSTEVQVALFTKHISNLTEHLKINKKDYQARRGLLVFVVKRKRLLIYLKNKSNDRYEKVIKELKLKRV
ncbi:MAG: 30S ribosomal protein S15 [Candidatus Midichloriaceae bacterium]